MCGRFTIVRPLIDYVRAFGLVAGSLEFFANANASPTQHLPIVAETESKTITLAKWGMMLGRRLLINARSETLVQKPTFREAFLKRRCLVLADGFYEWKKEGTKKIPFWITVKNDAIFGLAGVYFAAPETHTTPKMPKDSFVIVTTQANDLVGEVHDRMPVILTKETAKAWLDPTASPVELQNLMVPFSSNEMRLERGRGDNEGIGPRNQ